MKKSTVTKKIRLLFGSLMILSFLVTICNVLLPLFLEGIVDSAVNQAFQTAYKGLALYGIIIAVLLLFELLKKMAAVKYSCLLTENLRETLTDMLMKLTPARFMARANAEYLSLFNNNIRVIVDEYYVLGIDIIFNCFLLITCCIALYIINPVIALVVTSSNLLTLAAPLVFKRKLERQKGDVLNSLRKYNVKLGDSIAGFTLIRFNLIQKAIQQIVSGYSHKHLKSDLHHNYTISIVDVIVGAFSFLSVCIMLFICIRLVALNRFTIGGIFAAMQISDLISAPFINISSALGTCFAAKSVKNSLFKDFVEPGDSADKACLRGEISRIELRNVSFSYEMCGNNEPSRIFNGMNLAFEQGKKYLIVGGNGSGKSTLLRLMAGVYQDYQGEILVNGMELKRLNTEDLYLRMGYVQQSPFMFNDSVRNNVTLYGDYPQALIDSVLSKVRLGIKDTQREYADSAVSLSGGEQQKIALSRVILQDKRWLLLDEATSAMDAKSGGEIERMLVGNPELTIIHVAHKLTSDIALKYDAIIRIGDKDAMVINNKTSMELFLTELRTKQV